MFIKALGLGHNALDSWKHRHMTQCRVVLLTWRVARLQVPRPRSDPGPWRRWFCAYIVCGGWARDACGF